MAPSTDPDALVFRPDGQRPEPPEGLSPHSFRRTFASWLVYEGENVAHVIAQLGHRSERMTVGVYTHAVRQRRTSLDAEAR